MIEKLDKKSEFGDRFSEIRREFCENSNQIFAEKIDVSKNTISNYCGGTKKPGEKVLEKVLVAFPEISRVWLFFGKGSMLNQASAPSINTINQKGDNTQNNNVSDIDVSKLIDTISNQQQTIQSLVEMLKTK